MQRTILSFYKNERDHWTARLDCGHTQTVRHNPPWVNRRWILREETRRQRIGTSLNCKSCDEPTRQVSQARQPAAQQTEPGKPAVRYLRSRGAARARAEYSGKTGR